nr:spore coat protein GerQ [Bacillus subtilis]
MKTARNGARRFFAASSKLRYRDHIIISDPKSGTRYLLLTIYLDYITFDEEIAYTYPYSMASYSPR